MKQYALITGSTSGLGAEFANQLANQGYHLLLIARSTAILKKQQIDLITKFGIEVDYLTQDLSCIDADKKVLEWLDYIQITPTVLINNAGFGLFGHTLDQQIDTLKQMILLNDLTLTALTLEIGKRMKNLTVPCYILNVASTAAFQSGPLLAVYYASKAFVLSFSESLHEETKHSNIHVSALCPGPTKTEFEKRANLHNSKLFSSLAVSTPEIVVKKGLKTLFKRKAICIPGINNKLVIWASKFLPRILTRKFVYQIQKQRQ